MKSIAVYLTGACNLRCKHCSVGLDQYKPRKTLGDDQIIHALDKAAERKVPYVTLLGGEPTYSGHDLNKIAEHATNVGVKLSINTNLFFVERLLPLFDHKALSNIVVSMDGASVETHNAMRGKGSFETTLRNLEILVAERDARRPDLTIDLTFVLTDLNKEDSFSIIDLAESSGIHRLNVNLINPVGRGDKFREKLLGGDEYLDAIARLLAYYQFKRPRVALSVPLPPVVAEYIEVEYKIPAKIFENDTACGGTEVYTYLDLKGNLLPCPGLSFEEGRNEIMDKLHDNLDITKKSISEIEESSVFKAFNKAQKSKSKNRLFEPCNVCKYQDTCSPCTSNFYKKDQGNVIDMCMRVFRKLGDDSGVADLFPFAVSGEGSAVDSADRTGNRLRIDRTNYPTAF